MLDNSMMKTTVLAQMHERAINLEEVADLVYQLQEGYDSNLTHEICLEAVDAVLNKREVQYAILTGLALDVMAEKNMLPEPLQGIIACDEPLYGIDEVLGMAITNIYGTIGVTSFGYLDKLKIGLVGKLDSATDHINTFADDLVAAIASAAAAKIAHGRDTNDVKLK